MSRCLRVILVLFAIASLYACAANRIKQYKVDVVKTYPHSPQSYTQGLFFHEGKFYESTGLEKESRFMNVDLNSGKAVKTIHFADKYFVEGSVILADKLYILTWLNNVAFVYNAKSLEYEKTYSYPRPGWGLTTNGKELIASDGSANIYFMTAEFKPVRQLVVRKEGKIVTNINELEYIEGKIWANVYMTDTILIISPDTGEVEAIVDCSKLSAENLEPKADVLNGIAYDKETKKIYITGKNWKTLYEIKLSE